MFALIVFLPLLGALYAGLFCRAVSARSAQLVTSGLLVLSAILSWAAFFQANAGYEEVITLFRWIESGGLNVSWQVRIDVLSATMLILVTTVSSIVHIYSIGYMSHDPHKQRFMAYLSLFTFFMLVLVTAENFLQLFVGWEGVGLCSYLLIGFWFKKESANRAAMKAFLVNRVADAFFILGMCGVFVLFGSLDFSDVLPAASRYADETMVFLGTEFHALTLICVLLFIGAMGKSAQLFLHTWLPDAMEGPTPVSALIHAATMVTAGVFLTVRCSHFFELSPFALDMVTVVGAATAIFAASVAVTQHDIKRVIAYSTCSQLGYMFFACGVSAYSAAMFHMVTHGFFKALLFLCAGNVIHSLSDEQDMRRMGGIRKYVPQTHALFIIGTLALVGIFPFAGYYSKDLILESAFVSEGAGRVAFYIGIGAALLTAFYSARVMALTFYGAPRASEEVMSHIHESPKVMTLPLYVLALGAVFSGVAGYYLLHVGDASHTFWRGAISLEGQAAQTLEAAHHVSPVVKYTPLVLGVIGLLAGYIVFAKRRGLAEGAARAFGPVYTFLRRKWFFDELYAFIFVRPGMRAADMLWRFVDVKIIDRFLPGGAASAAKTGACAVSRAQSGLVYDYALLMLAGLAVCIAAMTF